MKTKTERMAEVAAKLRQTSFYQMPASTKYHNNFQGGLFDHCTGVWLNLELLTQKLRLEWEHPSSPFVIAMLHDACKIDAYRYNEDCGCWERNESHRTGHGDLSLEIIANLGIELTDEEKACIRWHMGAFDDRENWGKYTNAIHTYPNVLWTHTADMMSAHLDEVREDKGVCCFCGEPIQEFGNNPWPVSTVGVCCDFCNSKIVVPERIKRMEEKL